jgi:hypothetical protein
MELLRLHEAAQLEGRAPKRKPLALWSSVVRPFGARRLGALFVRDEWSASRLKRCQVAALQIGLVTDTKGVQGLALLHISLTACHSPVDVGRACASRPG